LGFDYVTLTATLSPPTQNARFQWDFDNDGIFDTPLSPNPTVTVPYPPFTTFTAVVKAVKGSHSATGSVTFRTLFCPAG
jgi:hypothetical protein